MSSEESKNLNKNSDDGKKSKGSKGGKYIKAPYVIIFDTGEHKIKAPVACNTGAVLNILDEIKS